MYHLLLVFLLGIGTSRADPLKLKLPNGVVYGHQKQSYGGRTFTAFEGIPYAKPPVGDLRFEEPQPAGQFDHELPGNKTYMCMQFSPFPMMKGPRGDEDCLYVYVYVPGESIPPNDKLLDVVVHIHGGAFMIGAPNFMAGPDFIMDKDLVYVTLNYRLGMLGFLSTEDDVVPGNNGLKDQAMALKWIQNNIRQFGGNPDSVTITGLSAGGASVHYHYLSPLSKGLFHRGFSQSGTALTPWALAENPLSRTKILADNFQCGTASTKEMIECLKKQKAPELIDVLKKMLVFMDMFPISPFAPVVEPPSDHAFISEHPYKLLRDGKIANDVPWVTSNVKDEGLFVVSLLSFLRKVKDFFTRWDELSPVALDYMNTVEESKYKEVNDKIREFYFKTEKFERNYNLTILSQMFSDRLFTVDAEKTIRLHAKASQSPVYYYFFSYLLEQPGFFGALPIEGVMHSDDGKLMFKMMGTVDELPKNDVSMKELFMDFLNSFATTGIPKMGPVEWKPVTNDLNTLHIGTPNQIQMEVFSSLGPIEFWNSLPIMENEHITFAK